MKSFKNLQKIATVANSELQLSRIRREHDSTLSLKRQNPDPAAGNASFNLSRIPLGQRLSPRTSTIHEPSFFPPRENASGFTVSWQMNPFLASYSGFGDGQSALGVGDSAEHALDVLQTNKTEELDKSDRTVEYPDLAGKEFVRALREAEPGAIVWADQVRILVDEEVVVEKELTVQGGPGTIIECSGESACFVIKTKNPKSSVKFCQCEFAFGEKGGAAHTPSRETTSKALFTVLNQSALLLQYCFLRYNGKK